MITCRFENGREGRLRHVVVHGIVEREGKILLVKRAGPILETGKWSLPAGFLDRDETAPAGIVRELYEETGWETKVTAWFRINTNPDRPQEDRQNISIDFLLIADKQTGQPDAENSEIAWVPVADLPPLDSLAFDHGQSLGLYLGYREHPFPLPLVV